MTKHFGWLGLLAGLALVPSACDGDDDTIGTAGSGGSGNASNAGHGGSNAGKGGASGKGGSGGSSDAGRGGSAPRGGSNGSGTGGTVDTAGGGGDEPGMSGAPGSGGTTAGAGGESAAAGQPGGSGQAGQAGNGGEGGEAPTQPLEIEGTWQTDFGETDVIDADSWSQDYGTGPTVSAIVKFSNTHNVAIRQAPADAMYSPNTFDRTVWTEVDGGQFYYCTIDFGLDTAEEAEESTTPFDASDPENGGCSSFPWTKLTAP